MQICLGKMNGIDMAIVIPSNTKNPKEKNRPTDKPKIMAPVPTVYFAVLIIIHLFSL